MFDDICYLLLWSAANVQTRNRYFPAQRSEDICGQPARSECHKDEQHGICWGLVISCLEILGHVKSFQACLHTVYGICMFNHFD